VVALGDFIVTVEFLARLASYVAGMVLLTRWRGGRWALTGLASAYLGAGILALVGLPYLTGEHYDYFDVWYADKNGALVVPGMDVKFVVYHLGAAFCAGAVVLGAATRVRSRLALAALCVALPISVELTVHLSTWLSYFYSLPDWQAERVVWRQPGSTGLALLGPALVAGCGLMVPAIRRQRSVAASGGRT
jgi:hypothetical protein